MIYIPNIADASGRLLVSKTATCPTQISSLQSDLPVDAQNRHSRLFLLFAKIVRNMQSWSVNGLQTVYAPIANRLNRYERTVLIGGVGR